MEYHLVSLVFLIKITPLILYFHNLVHFKEKIFELLHFMKNMSHIL